MKKLVTVKASGDASMLREVFSRYYFSSVLAIVCSCIGSIVGNIVVGNSLGEEKLAVSSLILPVYYVFATVGNLAGIGGSALCATYIGKRRNEDCKKAFTATYLMTLALCVLFGILFLCFLPGIVSLLGTPETLMADVLSYSRITVLGGIFTAGIYLSFNFLRLDGRPVATTLTFVIMAVVNVGLDVALMGLGVSGVALATELGSAAATVFGLAVLMKKSSLLRFTRMRLKEICAYSLQVFKVGSPGATENGGILLKSYIFNRMIVAIIGSASLSALSVVNSLNSFSQAITIGCAGALVPLVGVFSAERDTVSIRRMLRTSVFLSMGILILFMLPLMLLAPEIAGIFGVENNLQEAQTAIQLFGVSLPFALLTNVLIYLHLANGHTAISNILTALRGFVLPVGAAFVLMRLLGSDGLWLSFPLFELLTLGAAAVMHLIAKMKNPDLSFALLLNCRYEKHGAAFATCVQDTDEGIASAVEELEAFCDKAELMPKQTMRLTLSIDEMAHLAAKYSTCDSKRHIISIRVMLLDGTQVVRLRYDGRMFNPIEFYEQKKTDKTDIDAMLELADMLGMKLITDACDVVDYRTTFGINNLTVITGEDAGKKAVE